MPAPASESWRRGFDELVGYELDDVADGEVRAHVAVRDDLLQPRGLVHGGVYASIAESVASLATAFGVHGDNLTASGQSNQTTFLRPVTKGTIHVLARRIHRGRTSWVWEVECRDDDDRLCAVVRMTIAVRPLPPGVTLPPLPRFV